MNISLGKREVSILRTPHKIKLASIGKCPKCGQAHGVVGFQKSKSTPHLYFGTCPVNKTKVFIVDKHDG